MRSQAVEKIAFRAVSRSWTERGGSEAPDEAEEGVGGLDAQSSVAELLAGVRREAAPGGDAKAYVLRWEVRGGGE